MTELADRADVNRVTFYAHYQDIYDMFDEIKSKFSDLCRNLVAKHADEVKGGNYTELIEDIMTIFTSSLVACIRPEEQLYHSVIASAQGQTL